MKIDVSVDCTPEEARRFMGLPDMTPIHDLYIEKLRETINDGVSPEYLDRLMRSWAPMGEAGFNAWKQLVDQMTGLTGGKHD